MKIMRRDITEKEVIEVKTSDKVPSNSFKALSSLTKPVRKIQLVKNLTREQQFPNGIEIRKLADFLAKLGET